jgi:hypothetical protein
MKRLHVNKQKSNHKDEIKTSPIDRAWGESVGTTRVANSSNSTKVKLIKVLKKCSVIHIVAKTFQIPTFGSMDCPTPSSIL